MDTDSFIVNVNTNTRIKDLKNLGDTFDFNSLDKNHDLFSNKNEKEVGRFRIETPKSLCIDEYGALRSEMYSSIV